MSGGHTPGPWVIDTSRINDQGKNFGGYWQIDAQFDAVACNQYCYASFNREQSIANARLIAAAPELLDVANDALDAMLTLDDGALGYADGPMDAEGKGYTYPIKDELIAKLTAAIAKAKGGAA